MFFESVTRKLFQMTGPLCLIKNWPRLVLLNDGEGDLQIWSDGFGYVTWLKKITVESKVLKKMSFLSKCF
jgi:hypothetical protein